MRHSIHPVPPSQHRGAALFISLMFLIVLTLIGLSAANVGIMQERMAGNVKESNEAFQNAEATLREIEQEVRIIVEGHAGSIGSIPVFPQAMLTLGISRSNCTLSEVPTGSWPWSTAPSTGNGYAIFQLTDTVDGSGLPFASACAPMFDTGDVPIKPFGNVFVIGSRGDGPAGIGEVVVQSIFNW
ncbi:MAG: hypothetical protein CVV18_05665 [Gammaproteobacteria bacterium HGW-Gammaproteobacteria-8]|nr:MAG: hypothetical protein CVV18_05665 [Gammaproteobacteria bacterium HGW-Gammaproteobacteria-8]